MATFIAMLTILLLSFVQNISFSIVSRSRNRNNMKYHLVAALFSNTIWFITFRQLVKADMTFLFFVPYCIGTMLGSVFGVKISMFFEKLLGAKADGHLPVMTMTMQDSGNTHKEVVDYLYYLSTPTRIQDRHYNFQEWIDAGQPDSFSKLIDRSKIKICPACKINETAPNRDTCVDCSH